MVIRLNAQYASTVRTSLSMHARLMRAQAVRQKREAIDGAAAQDAWTLQVAKQSMLEVTDPDIERLAAARPKAVPSEAPVAAPAPQGNQENVSENNPNSHHTALETWMSKQPWNQGSEDRLKRVCASVSAKQ